MVRKVKVDAEAPEITARMFARMRPMKEAMPELAQAHKALRGRPKIANPKRVVSIRLSESIRKHWIALSPKQRAALVTSFERKIAQTA